MSRYRNTKILKDRVTKNKIFASTEYPIIVRKDSDITYYVRFDDTYMSLAQRFYSDQTLWWIIARANNNFAGNFTMVIGSKIIIPTEIGEILSKLAKLNR
jgi:nucleoid-associated protein YgaU